MNLMMGFVSPQARWVGLSANPWPTSQFSSCLPETRNVSVGYSLMVGWGNQQMWLRLGLVEEMMAKFASESRIQQNKKTFKSLSFMSPKT